jgi:hypothetical protein
MKGSESPSLLAAGLRALRLHRVLVVSAVALLAGLACDWFRSGERMIFPRPLPIFTISAP